MQLFWLMKYYDELWMNTQSMFFISILFIEKKCENMH